MDSMTNAMCMYFNVALPVHVLFDSWLVETNSQLWAATIEHNRDTYNSYSGRKTMSPNTDSQLQEQTGDINKLNSSENSNNNSICCSSELSEEFTDVFCPDCLKSYKTSTTFDFIYTAFLVLACTLGHGFFHLLQVSVMFLIMLVVMTFNTFFFFGIVLGSSVGYMIGRIIVCTKLAARKRAKITQALKKTKVSQS
eukprot:Awhi_evm1s14317